MCVMQMWKKLCEFDVYNKLLLNITASAQKIEQPLLFSKKKTTTKFETAVFPWIEKTVPDRLIAATLSS